MRNLREQLKKDRFKEDALLGQSNFEVAMAILPGPTMLPQLKLIVYITCEQPNFTMGSS